ncbi:MAG: hypothetical protein J0L52_06895 [Caulobacterales bacterium]|nr:hypothetical protein [Caulobacterales bacterium]
MVELFGDYWWLIFPLAWMLGSAWQGWLKEQARRDELRLIETYAAAGREPPAELMSALRHRPEEG